MRRVVVLGTSGAGKSTVAEALARRHGLPHFDLDDVPADDFRAHVAEIVAGDRWVVDGDFQRLVGDLVLGEAETAVWLDLPLRVSLRRMWTRTRVRDGAGIPFAYRGRTGLLARVVWVQWEVRSHLRRKRTMPPRLARHSQLTAVRLRSQHEVDAWLRAS